MAQSKAILLFRAVMIVMAALAFVTAVLQIWRGFYYDASVTVIAGMILREASRVASRIVIIREPGLAHDGD